MNEDPVKYEPLSNEYIPMGKAVHFLNMPSIPASAKWVAENFNTRENPATRSLEVRRADLDKWVGHQAEGEAAVHRAKTSGQQIRIEALRAAVSIQGQIMGPVLATAVESGKEVEGATVGAMSDAVLEMAKHFAVYLESGE